MKVLVAEDSKSNLLYLQACIQDAGFEVITAINGQQAVEKFDQHSPDLVLLDIVMPEMDGIEAARIIKSRTDGRDKWIPIVFLSAMDSDEDVVKGLEIGGDDYIRKPVSQVILSAKLHAMQRICEMQKQLDYANRELKRITERDALTGLANRRKFDEYLVREWRRAARKGDHLSLCLFDIDHFKLYNDNYGHRAGDDALCAVASALGKSIRRPGDLVARYGGEEFVVVLPETDLEGSIHMVERARQTVEELKMTHAHSESGIVTVSCGVTTVRPDDEPSNEDIGRLIESADQGLYKAKELGRNQVVTGQYQAVEAAAS